MSKPVKHFYEFGPFRLDARERLLSREGEPVPLTPKAFDVLLLLVQNSGRMLEKEELMKSLWPDSIVEEANLSVNISMLRKALGQVNEEKYIETVPKRGYRFVAQVQEVLEDAPSMIVHEHMRAQMVVEEEEDDAGEQGGKGEGVEELSSHRLASSPVHSFTRLPIYALVVVVLVGVAAWLGYAWIKSHSSSAESSISVKSIAVLPFKPLGADESDEVLGLGMADTLITKLSNVQQLIVRPTSAVRKYGSLDQDPLAAGREQRVEAVLDGSIQREGEKVRVTVRLLSVADGRSLWAHQFSAQHYTGLFAVQDAISEQVVDALMLKLKGEEHARLAKRHTENPEAYQLYLKGRYFWSKWTKPSLQKAIEYFEQARALDSNYALAYSGLADSYHLLGYLGFPPPRETYPKSEAAVRQSLQLDDTLGEAHLVLAKLKLFYEWDLAGAERETTRALELNPQDFDGHSSYGSYLMAVGRLDEAMIERKRGLELDPLSPLATNAVGWVYFYQHQYDQAIEWYKKALELDPQFGPAHNDLGNAYSLKGDDDEAVAEFLQAKTLSGVSPETIAALRQAYATSGIKGYLQKELELAADPSKSRPTGPWRMARIYTELGDKDQAFAWLDRAYDERVSTLIFLKVVPLFDSLHSDPRFAALLRRIGLAP